MGGQNHQPTREKTLIAPSAWLSQKVGEGLCCVLEANGHLEDAIILAMQQLHVEKLSIETVGTCDSHLDASLTSLKRSLSKLKEIELGYENLLTACAKEGYLGNPLAPTVKQLELERAFSGVIVNPGSHHHAWTELEEQVSKYNIPKTLEWERSRFCEVVKPTEKLIEVIRLARDIWQAEGDDAFVNAIELNEIPLRHRYARVFSLWNYLHAMFLYSSLLMTELFYRVSGYPSLTDSRNIGREPNRTPVLPIA